MVFRWYHEKMVDKLQELHAKMMGGLAQKQHENFGYITPELV
jgi:hypothetical protein